MLEDVQEQEQRFFKVDVTNSRVKEQTGRWDDATLVNGVAYSSVNDVYEGATIVGEFTLEYSPAGRISIQGTTTMDGLIQTMNVNGTCQSSDKDTFEVGASQ